MHEFEWIARYFAPLTFGRTETLGLKGDAALLGIALGKQLVITTDSLNAGIHFLPDTAPQDIAHKALAVNLSDLAAMGASPLAYSLALSLPAETNEAWISTFCDGLRGLQQAYDFFLLGGDTTRTNGPLSITITAFGLVESGKALRRCGAQVDDGLYVTGSIGDAFCGLQTLIGCHSREGRNPYSRNLSIKNKTLPAEDMYPRLRGDDNEKSWLIQRHRMPTPRITIGKLLSDIATACMDISDGLLQDAGHIAAASGVGLAIQAHHVPLSAPARHFMEAQEVALADLLSGGDDYELLFSAPVEKENDIRSIAKETGVPITLIGQIISGNGVILLDANGSPITYEKAGWQHF